MKTVAMAKVGLSSKLSPIVKVKQWIGNIDSPSSSSSSRRGRRSLSVEYTGTSNFEVESGCKSAPGSAVDGQDFTDLKRLRDICRNGFGKNSYEDSPSNQSSHTQLYVSNDDLNSEEYNVSLESKLLETVYRLKRNEKDLCPRRFDNIYSLNTNGAFLPVSGHAYVDVSNNVSTGSLETSCTTIMSSESIESPMTNARIIKDKCDRYNQIDSESFDTISLKGNTCSHKTDNSKDASSLKNSTKKTMRLKIRLKYSKNKRQLRLLLLTVELLKPKNCKLFVKLSLISSTSEQKKMSRRVCCYSSTVDLYEFLYLDVEDGMINGKTLRMRLCKETNFFKREKTIGKASVALDDLDISFDTCLWLGLRECNTENMVTSSSFELVSDSKCSREEPKSVIPLSENLHDSDLQLLLDCPNT